MTRVTSGQTGHFIQESCEVFINQLLPMPAKRNLGARTLRLRCQLCKSERAARAKALCSAENQSLASDVTTTGLPPFVVISIWQRLSMPPRGPLMSDRCTRTRGVSQASRLKAWRTRRSVKVRSSVAWGSVDSKMICMSDLSLVVGEVARIVSPLILKKQIIKKRKFLKT